MTSHIIDELIIVTVVPLWQPWWARVSWWRCHGPCLGGWPSSSERRQSASSSSKSSRSRSSTSSSTRSCCSTSSSSSSTSPSSMNSSSGSTWRSSGSDKSSCRSWGSESSWRRYARRRNMRRALSPPQKSSTNCRRSLDKGRRDAPRHPEQTIPAGESSPTADSCYCIPANLRAVCKQWGRTAS